MATPAHQSNGNATSEIPTVAMARRSLAWDAEIPGRDVINEPDTIVRDEEWVPIVDVERGTRRSPVPAPFLLEAAHDGVVLELLARFRVVEGVVKTPALLPHQRALHDEARDGDDVA